MGATSLNIPDKGDYLVFDKEYTFVTQDSFALEIPKGTLAKVIERDFHHAYGDELECVLIISLNFTGETKMFKFNYSVHQNLVNILPESKATKLLYDKK